MSNFVCQTCGTDWSGNKSHHSYYFESASIPKGSDKSPAQIVALAEDITFCPSCITGDLYDVTRRMDDLKPGTYVARGRFPEKEEPDPGQGDATVVHRPIF